jgi:hypothetical protein
LNNNHKGNESISEKVNSTKVLENNIILSLASEHLKIDKNLQIVDDKSNQSLSELISNNPKLVLRYSEIACNSCVDAQLKILEKLAIKIGSENIIILASYKNNSSLWRFKRINNIRLNLYNIDNLGFSLERENIPFYFIIDNTFNVKMIFIPIKEKPYLTEKYFEILSSRFF